MIGRIVDRAALTLMGAVGILGFFQRMGLGIFASAGLTLAFAALAEHLWRHRRSGQKLTARQAEAALLTIAMMDAKAAEAALSALTGLSDATILLRHPETTLSLDALYALWREKGDHIAIVATCEVSQEAARFAKTRDIQIIDGGALVRRIRKTGACPGIEPAEEQMADRLGRRWQMIRVRPRMMAYGLGMLGTYIATGSVISLICALGVLGIMGAKMIEKYT